MFSSIERYWFESRAGTDSTNIQPFDFRIWSGADSVAAYNWVMINESGSRDTTVTLSATAGDAVTNKRKLQGQRMREIEDKVKIEAGDVLTLKCLDSIIFNKRSFYSMLNRSEEHTSELQSHSFISYAVFCLKKKKKIKSDKHLEV